MDNKTLQGIIQSKDRSRGSGNTVRLVAKAIEEMTANPKPGMYVLWIPEGRRQSQLIGTIKTVISAMGLTAQYSHTLRTFTLANGAKIRVENEPKDRFQLRGVLIAGEYTDY